MEGNNFRMEKIDLLVGIFLITTTLLHIFVKIFLPAQILSDIVWILWGLEGLVGMVLIVIFIYTKLKSKN